LNLTLTDLFVVGLGVELVGAWLIARGLLASPARLKSFGNVGALGAGDVAERARDRVDALFGMVYLLIGFLAQLIGYLAEIHGDHVSHGATRFHGALIALTVATVLAIVVWASLHRPALRSLLVAIAFASLRDDAGEVPGSRASNLALLAEYARAAFGGERRDEDNDTYLRRLYGDTGSLEPPRHWWWPGSWRRK
jgi:hypothetical protein